MSEYQHYEFLAIDRPLTGKEQDEVRSLSTRARITSTSFVNEYNWGDFRGDPNRLMQRYYDAHLYVANWGTRRLMLRLPSTLLEAGVVEEYCIDDHATATVSGDSIVLDFVSEDESGEYGFDDDGQALLSAIIGVRADLAGGDLRPLYLAWLASCSSWDLDAEVFDGDLEPPVPSGLGQLTAAQRAFADFLRVDEDLLAIAARNSPPIEAPDVDPGALADWVQRLPEAEKGRHLLRVMQGKASLVGAELQRRYREASVPETPTPPRRTVAALFGATARLKDESSRRLAAERAEAEARWAKERAQALAKRLDALAVEGNAAWSRVEALIATRKPAEYDSALALLRDLQALAERDDRLDEFTTRTATLRNTHARKVSLIERLDRAGI